MGWVWKDEAEEDTGSESYYPYEFQNSNPKSSDRCSTTSSTTTTRKIVKSQCRTEEVEPGKFVRKCHKIEQILRDSVGRPSEVVQSNTKYTEEDVSDQVTKGSIPLQSSELGPFDFPGLRSDMESIERNFFGGLSRLFEAAEETKNGFFSVFGSPHISDGDSSTASSRRRGMPIEDNPPKEASPKFNNAASGHVDLSGLARDV